MNLVTKIILLITLLMAAVIVLYTYANEQSIGVVEDQINLANQDRLEHFIKEIEDTLDQVSKYSNILTKDSDFAELAANALPANRYDYSTLAEAVERKLGLFGLSSDWMSRINLYFPASGRALSSHTAIQYDEAYLRERMTSEWRFREVSVNGIEKRAFSRFFVEPYAGISDLKKASIIVEVDLMEDNIVALLDSFKTKGNNDPFLFKAPGQFIMNGSSNETMARQITEAYDWSASSSDKKHEMIILDNKKYLVYFFTSPKINWTLVDYVPLEDILAPVTRSRYLFYVTAAMLLLVGGVAVFLMYVHLQIPIKLLTASVRQLKQGRFSTRVKLNPKQEFHELSVQFNEMAEQIQHLVEKVYFEEIRAKEAVMKQLQSQINPHFLYNCLAYIISMAKMKRSEPVVSMAYSLADYYKYTARNVTMTTTLKEELDFVSSYIRIMNDQLNKIRCTVSVPPTMERLVIPRLLIQPIVENAIIHGLETKLENGEIRIHAAEEQEYYTITVEDDGSGLTDDKLERLNAQLAAEEAQGDSFGLWNVNQRLRYQFGKESGLRMEPSPLGGVRARLQWRKQLQVEGGGEHAVDSARG
ncbi:MULTISPECIES: sensor histidine kinase [unclassified Paenibacillus]|uniref:sensor histidine kinase n=1 Tax=unclassified Paenibacillus TaxID=185978 RepID=UPI0009310565|nr:MULTISPECIES: sensor histidine kinase [unclassified Paenibacillus]